MLIIAIGIASLVDNQSTDPPPFHPLPRSSSTLLFSHGGCPTTWARIVLLQIHPSHMPALVSLPKRNHPTRFDSIQSKPCFPGTLKTFATISLNFKCCPGLRSAKLDHAAIHPDDTLRLTEGCQKNKPRSIWSFIRAT